MTVKAKIISLTVLGIVPFITMGLSACSGEPSSQMSSPTSNASTPADTMPHGSTSAADGMNHDSMHTSLGPKDEMFDLRFIDGMMLHHRGAIQMAEEALQKSNRPEIKQLAQSIIDAQRREVSDLQEWRNQWYPNASEEPVMHDPQMGHTMPMSEDMQQKMAMAEDLGAADEEFDLRFMKAMIVHHEGALTMAQEAQEKSDRPEIKELAQSIINSQQQEIDQMKQWQQDWYGTSAN